MAHTRYCSYSPKRDGKCHRDCGALLTCKFVVEMKSDAAIVTCICRPEDRDGCMHKNRCSTPILTNAGCSGVRGSGDEGKDSQPAPDVPAGDASV